MSDGLFLSALGVLATVIGVLWKINRESSAKIEDRADKIEKKYEDNTNQLIEMKGELGELRGKVDLAEKVVPLIQELHEDFLNEFPKKEE